MEMVFQLLSIEDGTRSECIRCERDKFCDDLEKVVPDDKRDTTMVIVVMDQIKGDWGFSQAPLLHVSRFIEVFRHG